MKKRRRMMRAPHALESLEDLKVDEQIMEAETPADDDLLQVTDRRRSPRSRNARRFDAAQSAPLAQADVKGKGRALSERDVKCRCGEHVAEEEMNPLIWRNLPPEIFNLVLVYVRQFPTHVVRKLNQGSTVMSMDFHPVQHSVLLVGTNVGDIGIWEVGSSKRLALRTFEVWDITVASKPLQAALVRDPAVSVNRTLWSPDGTLLGVAFSKHIVHTYMYNGGSDLRQHLEIDAHVGSVNDLAFSQPNKQLCVITCGDDKTIKVWDASTGQKLYTFEGHKAPVYSVCPHHKQGIQFIFSTAIDGEIKAWLYDLLGSRVDYDAPGHWCTTMAYSADGTRLFSCGTSKEGESFLVEWNESEGVIKRTYNGFCKHSSGVVQFDTTRNRFLAAGDEFVIKFWDMDSMNLLCQIEADGGLPASPRLRFNKDGSLLAVTASDNGIKILANRDGMQMLRAFESRAYDANHAPPEPAVSKPPVGNALGVVSSQGQGQGGGERENSTSMPRTVMDGPTLNMGGVS